MPALMDRASLLDLDRSLAVEWALTNRIGVRAAASALGANTRRGHGLLCVPGGASGRLLVAKVDEEVEVDDRDGGERVALSTNEYHDGTIHPTGYVHLEQAEIVDGRPTWRWRYRDLELEKSIALASDSPTVVVRYRLLSSPAPAVLRVSPFLTDRPADDATVGSVDWRFAVDRAPDGCGAIARARDDSPPVAVFGWATGPAGRIPARLVETGHWYWRFKHRAEREVGPANVEDLYTPGLLAFDLVPGGVAWLVATADPHLIAAPGQIDPAKLLAPALTRVAAPSGNGHHRVHPKVTKAG
jgi:predicted glycogen debranching enzyme